MSRHFAVLLPAVLLLSGWGDLYLFTGVRANGPGDTESRSLNSMAFFIR